MGASHAILAFVKKKKTRRRRSAEDARALILDAAEKRLAEAGPGGIRLQDVAAEVGISHPAILHHFGSREGLVRAVVDRAMRSLEADLVTALHSNDGAPPDGAAMLDAVFAMLAEKGHGRLLAWLVLSGYEDALHVDEARASWKAITDATHALRVAAGVKADREDTAFTVILAALAMFGQSIAGRTTFRMAGVDRGAEKRFRRWLAGVLTAHLERGG